MPCKTTEGKKKKPPRAWFDRMYEEVKVGNPDYSDEQVRSTVGAIWFKNLSPKQKAKAKSIQSEGFARTLASVTSSLEKGVLGSVRPGHRYIERKPARGGRGFIYRYKERVKRAIGGPEKKKEYEQLLAPSEKPPEHEPGEIVEVYDPNQKKWRKAKVKATLPSPRGQVLHGSGGPSDYDFWVQFLQDGQRAVTPFLIRPVAEKAAKGMAQINDFEDLWGYARECGLIERRDLGKSHNEEGTHMKESQASILDALVDMDTVRAMNEGKTGLDMLKGVSGELSKALPPGPGEEETLEEHEIEHAKKTPPKEYREEGAKSGKDYADPKNFKYPVHTAANARNALARLAQNKGTYTSEQLESVARRIVSACKKYGIEVSDDWKEGMGIKEKEVKKSLSGDEEDEGEGLGTGGGGRGGKPKSEEERKKTHKKRFGTEELPERGTGLKMLRSVNAGLDKPLRKSVDAGPKGVSFTAKGEKIQAGIAAKVTELSQKLTKLLARHPNCSLDDESRDYPIAVGESSGTASADLTACGSKEEHWEIRDLRRKIDRLQRVARNIDPKKTFSLSQWDLEEYGL